MTHWNAAYAGQELAVAGSKVVEQREEFPATRFYDAGAIVFYLKAVPWQISDFTVEKYLDALLRVHERIQRDGFVDVRGHCFLILAEKS
jgi:hypothetical protein